MRSLKVIAAALLIAPMATAESRHEGYYYPPITSEEVFDRVAVDGPVPYSNARNDLVTRLTSAQIASQYAPRYAMFAKGGSSEKLIIVALDDEIFSTLYRARALMAYLTSDMRGGEFFVRAGLQFEGTFFDMLQMFGFEELVISDGKSWSHKVKFIRK